MGIIAQTKRWLAQELHRQIIEHLEGTWNTRIHKCTIIAYMDGSPESVQFFKVATNRNIKELQDGLIAEDMDIVADFLVEHLKIEDLFEVKVSIRYENKPIQMVGLTSIVRDFIREMEEYLNAKGINGDS